MASQARAGGRASSWGCVWGGAGSPDLATHLQLPGEVWCPRLAVVAEGQAEVQAMVWVRGEAHLAAGIQQEPIVAQGVLPRD